MYDDSDLDAAVAAGTLSEPDVQKLRRFVAARRTDPPALGRDRHFRYTASAADLLPTIGVVAVMIGVALVAQPLLGSWGAAAVALTAWLLAERFAPRRLSVPTTVLFVFFAVSCAVTLAGAALGQPVTPGIAPGGGLIVAGGCALASFAFWKRFRLPLAMPAALLATITIGDHLLMAAVPGGPSALVTGWTLVAALAMLVAAVWWDASDVYRQTLRADVAYWLHAIAAFQLIAALFRGSFGRPEGTGWGQLWVATSQVGVGATAMALAICLGAILLSVVLDRRAMAVFALLFTLRMATHSTDGAAAAAMLIAVGAGVLALTWRWTALRRLVLARLPLPLRAQLPRSDPQFWYERPVA
ncbi:hypothetical protein [Sphingomonas sp.]|jgi:hypothetical protein|uniref:hypothetical protein n=1 Tax=Sphingomonas sp. TaxID=28214 RepID=UPI002D807E4E|nr:hypothetical protein [Sphingomonas sp.]HEU0044450.1 hypothetical protein [Sphingomonas sp.]